MKGHPRPKKSAAGWGDVEESCRKDNVTPYGPMKTVNGGKEKES